MTLERLYTPWRLAYVTGAAKSSDCVFCTAQQTSDADALIVLRGSAIPKPDLAVLYMGIGGGLLLSSLHYYRQLVETMNH